MTKNTALKDLWCWNNGLSSLDVSKNTALTGLACYKNQLTSLDVSACPELKSLSFADNRIKGAAMDALIASLPKWEDGKGRFFAVAPKLSSEQNELTKAQLDAAKEKGWTTYCWNGTSWDSGSYVIYELGAPTAIPKVNPDADAGSPFYSLNGQRLSGTPTQPGVYVRAGKKVMVR